MTRQISGAALFLLGSMAIWNSALNGMAFLVCIVKHLMGVSSRLTALGRQMAMTETLRWDTALRKAQVPVDPTRASPPAQLQDPTRDAFPAQCHKFT